MVAMQLLVLALFIGTRFCRFFFQLRSSDDFQSVDSIDCGYQKMIWTKAKNTLSPNRTERPAEFNFGRTVLARVAELPRLKANEFPIRKLKFKFRAF